MRRTLSESRLACQWWYPANPNRHPNKRLPRWLLQLNNQNPRPNNRNLQPSNRTLQQQNQMSPIACQLSFPDNPNLLLHPQKPQSSDTGTKPALTEKRNSQGKFANQSNKTMTLPSTKTS